MIELKKQNEISKKYLALISLVGFVFGYVIMCFCIPQYCIGCGGGYLVLHPKVVDYLISDIPLWLSLLSGVSFGVLCSALFCSYKTKNTKWIIMVICASLCYICCIYYQTYTCPPFVC